jgi:hypothetical protein
MRYSLNENFELQHIPYEHRIATYVAMRDGKATGAICLFVDYGSMRNRPEMVATFNQYLFCNNGCGFDSVDEAWAFFDKHRQLLLEEKNRVAGEPQ